VVLPHQVSVFLERQFRYQSTCLSLRVGNDCYITRDDEEKIKSYDPTILIQILVLSASTNLFSVTICREALNSKCYGEALIDEAPGHVKNGFAAANAGNSAKDIEDFVRGLCNGWKQQQAYEESCKRLRVKSAKPEILLIL
jgi:hypothetical protein